MIINEDCSGPGGSNMQTLLLLIQSPQVEVLGITVVSGDQWRDEEVAHTLRLLEIIGRTDIPVMQRRGVSAGSHARRKRSSGRSATESLLCGRLGSTLVARTVRRAAAPGGQPTIKARRGRCAVTFWSGWCTSIRTR